MLSTAAARPRSRGAELTILLGGFVLLGPLTLLIYQHSAAIGLSTPNGIVPAAVLALLLVSLWPIGARRQVARRRVVIEPFRLVISMNLPPEEVAAIWRGPIAFR